MNYSASQAAGSGRSVLCSDSEPVLAQERSQIVWWVESTTRAGVLFIDITSGSLFRQSDCVRFITDAEHEFSFTSFGWFWGFPCSAHTYDVQINQVKAGEWNLHIQLLLADSLSFTCWLSLSAAGESLEHHSFFHDVVSGRHSCTGSDAFYPVKKPEWRGELCHGNTAHTR